MNGAVKTRIKNYAELIDQAEDDFLDMPHREITAPKICQVPPALSVTENRGKHLKLAINEFLTALFFLFALGYFCGIIQANGVKSGNQLNVILDQIAGYLLIGLLPAAWVIGIYLYKRKSV